MTSDKTVTSLLPRAPERRQGDVTISKANRESGRKPGKRGQADIWLSLIDEMGSKGRNS